MRTLPPLMVTMSEVSEPLVKSEQKQRQALFRTPQAEADDQVL